MQKLINFFMVLAAPLASIPTLWAIFAGLTSKVALPMVGLFPEIFAGAAATSIVIIDVVVSLHMAKAYRFKTTAKGLEEIKLIQPVQWSVVVLLVAIAGEIILSLVIVIFVDTLKFGVLVFPLMTLAGAATIALQDDLNSRIESRKTLRKEILEAEIKLKAEEEAKKEERRQKARETYLKKKETEQQEKLDKIEQEKAKQEEAELKELQCKICAIEGNFHQAHSKKELAGHMRKHPISQRKEKETKVVWSCPSCSTINNSDRKECRQCGFLRAGENGSEKEFAKEKQGEK